ncbi:MAG: hypothetical protein KGI50_07745 [Patescibacteria group bacterium]|nr:hypothetical protein [Patescibacteria group bacterium]MDE2438920.1 hypothetical protein [Patescibacteria group bacterium]
MAKAKKKSNVQLLTQAEAHKRWPKRGYDTYRPIEYIIAGTRRSVLAALRLVVKVDGKYIPITRIKASTIYALASNPDLVGYGLSIDIDTSNDFRIIEYK